MFILAQQLCERALEGIVKTPRTIRDVEVRVDELTAAIAVNLEAAYEHHVVDFSRTSQAHLATLWMLSKRADGCVALREVKERFPELSPSPDELARELSADHPLERYLHVDSEGLVQCGDLQFMFYLDHLRDVNWMVVALKAGFTVSFETRVLQFKTKDADGLPQRSILDCNVAEFWDRKEAGDIHLLLQSAYDKEDRIERIAHTAGIPKSDFVCTGAVTDIWYDLLNAAIKAAKLRRLVNAVLRDKRVARIHDQLRRLISAKATPKKGRDEGPDRAPPCK